MNAVPPPPTSPVALAVVVADGDVPSRAALDAGWSGWSDGLAWTIAADGGALRAEALGLAPDALVGDFDSLAPADVERFAAAGVRIERHPVAKDESDLELAVRAALARRPARIVVLGALGGRLDHTLANLWLLADAGLLALAGRTGTPGGWPAVACLDARTRVSLLAGPGRRELRGPPGDLVTLLPFAGEAAGITTDGLAYPLRGEALPMGPSRGLSNIRRVEDAAVTLRSGFLLIVETHRADRARPPKGAPR